MLLRVGRWSMRLACLFALGLVAVIGAATDELEHARKLYSYTDYEGSLKILLSLPAKDGSAYLLIGQNYYGLGDPKKASEAIEKAIAADPANSDYFLWMGRAYGRRAETSSP